MSFSFRNLFPRDESGNALGDRSVLEAAGTNGKTPPIQEYEVEEILPFLPPAIVARENVSMNRIVQIPLPDDGSNDVKLSTIYQSCPALFASEITPLNDSVVNLPPKIGNVKGNALKNAVPLPTQNPFSDGSEQTPAMNEAGGPQSPRSPNQQQSAMDSTSAPENQTFGFPNFEEDPDSAKNNQENSGDADHSGFMPPGQPEHDANNPFGDPAAPTHDPSFAAGAQGPFQGMPEGGNASDQPDNPQPEMNPFESAAESDFAALFNDQRGNTDPGQAIPGLAVQTGSAPAADQIPEPPEDEDLPPIGNLFEEATSGEFVGLPDADSLPPKNDPNHELAEKGIETFLPPGMVESEPVKNDTEGTPPADFATPFSQAPGEFVPDVMPDMDDSSDAPRAEAIEHLVDTEEKDDKEEEKSEASNDEADNNNDSEEEEEKSEENVAVESEKKDEKSSTKSKKSESKSNSEAEDSAKAKEKKKSKESKKEEEKSTQTKSQEASPAGACFNLAQSPMKDIELRAVFSTEETFTMEKIGRKVSELEGGFDACAIVTESDVIESAKEENLSLGENIREMADHARGLARVTGNDGASYFTVSTSQGIISFFFGQSSLLAIKHQPDAFLPGTREKLVLVTRALDGFQG